MGYTKKHSDESGSWVLFLLSLSDFMRHITAVFLLSCIEAIEPHRLSEVSKRRGVGRCFSTIEFLLSFYPIIITHHHRYHRRYHRRYHWDWKGKGKFSMEMGVRPPSCIDPHFCIASVRLSDFCHVVLSCNPV